MDKASLLEVVKNCNAGSEDEAREILSLRAQYPFSQLLHVLSAKIAREHRLPQEQEALQRAAVYASDRMVLKEIMETVPRSRPQAVEIPEAPALEINAVAPVTEREHEPLSDRQTGFPPIFHETPGLDVADTVLRDLRKLHESKHNFELLFADSDSTEMSTIGPVPGGEPGDDNTAATVAASAESAKSKREKIIELARSLGSTDQPGSGSRRKRKDPVQDHIIDEIQKKKEEIGVETERQKEQIQIIDHFIKTQPSIASNQKDRNILPAEDLNLIKSGEFSENIVSETLVEILIKQGKKDRAIEVLKKLIWKYPQKKAYFASQIEELKK